MLALITTLVDEFLDPRSREIFDADTSSEADIEAKSELDAG